MITAVLTTAVIWFMFYGQLPTMALAALSFGSGAALAFFGRHGHTRFLTVDVLAQMSRLNNVNPALKFWTVLLLMIICVSAKSAMVGLFLVAAMLILTVFAGGLRLADYIRLLALPVSFLMISGLVLLFEAADRCSGVLSFNVLGLWLCVSEQTQARAALVTARALGAVSCLYLLSLTTPMSEIIGVLRGARCPDVLIALMYLTYRYIFILLSMFYTMRDAAASRLGFSGSRTAIRTTGGIFSNLLAGSYRQAGRNFDAMESRCYDSEIRFLESRKSVTAAHAAAAFCVTAFTFGLSIIFR